MVLEKAYAKLFGSYAAIEGGIVSYALSDLTGGLGSIINMRKEQKSCNDGTLWTQVVQHVKAGYLLGAGSPAGSDSVDHMSSSGIVQGHAYSILDVQEIDNVKLISLRNPWGSHEWKGDWSDHDKTHWTRRMRSKLPNFEGKEDGQFWMSFLDFTINFEDIYVCRFFDPLTWVWNQQFTGSWKGLTAGGCSNYATTGNNPMFALKVTQDCDVVITLKQKETRGTNIKKQAIWVGLFQNGGNRLTRYRRGIQIGSSGNYINRTEVVLECHVKADFNPYTVFISTFAPEKEMEYTLTCYATEASVTLVELIPNGRPVNLNAKSILKTSHKKLKKR